MAVEILRPTGDGTYTELGSASDGRPHYAHVDEETPDDDTTYVESGGAADQRDTYTLPAHSEGSGTINHVKVYVRMHGESGTWHDGWILCYTHSTLYSDDVIDLPTAWTTYSKQWDTNPNTGSAWTWDEVDALEVGVRLADLGTSRPQCTQIYVEVDYTPAATPKTSSDAGAGVDAYVSLEKPEAKTSSDTGSGVEGTPMHSAILAGSETGSGIEAPVARLLAAVDTGTGVEVGGLLKDLFVTELGLGSDSLTAKIEMPTKGGGMKLWT